MKNILLSTLALSALLAVSCTKQNTVAVTDNWTMGGVSHLVKDTQSFEKGAQAYMAKDVYGNAIYFYFRSLPSMNGVYRIVHNQNPLSNQVVVSTQSIGQSAYQSIGDDSTDAVVTVSGDKVTIAVPNIWVGNVNTLINDSTWRPTDSTLLSATASFKNQNVPAPPSSGGSGFWNLGPYWKSNMVTLNRQDFNTGTNTDSTLVTVFDGSSNYVQYWFKKFPAGAGSYKVVSGTLQNDNDVRIACHLNWGLDYVSTGDGRTITVTSFSDGIGISIPHTWMANPGGNHDSLIFSSVFVKR
ncbi:hypothetical protein ACTHGU_18985 [Chitinophagaceae bacterium MMS25-I14]